MKNYFFAAIAASALLFSCKKNDKTSCDNTVAALAGNYKITKVTLAGQPATDLFFSDDCYKDDVYQFKADKTLVYDDAGTICNPPGDGSGSWDIVNNRLVVTQTSGDGADFDGPIANKCNSFEVTEDFMGQPLVVTFTKQ